MGASAEEYLKVLQNQRKRDNAQKMRGFYVDLSPPTRYNFLQR